jgi:hypothetical protein
LDVASHSPRAKGFYGGAFDGRYVYFVPAQNDAGDFGVLARYDTQGGAFTTGGAWSKFDMTSLDPNAKGFAGAAFDGRYLYLIPSSHTVVTRFDTKSVPAIPAIHTGSFF